MTNAKRVLKIRECDLSEAIETVLLETFSDAEVEGIAMRQSQAQWLAHRAIDRARSLDLQSRTRST